MVAGAGAVQVPAAAWRQPAGAAAARVMASPSEMKAAAGVAESVRPVASAPQARLPAEEAAAASGAKVQPPEAAEVLPGPSARQPGAAEAAEGVSGPSAQPPAAAEAVSGAAAVLPPEAAGVALDAAAEPQQAVAAAGCRTRRCARPGVVAAAAPVRSVRQPAVGHPSAPPCLPPGASFFLGLRHDERCGLRMRCGGRELRRRQGGRGEQQDAKVCHDVLGPRNRPDSNGTAFIGMSVGRLNG